MKEMALKLKNEYEKEHHQSLIRTQCKCGRFATVVMSSYVASNTIYAIIYCSRCNKFYHHSGGSTLEVWGETTYSCREHEIEYGSEKWDEIVMKIKEGNIFVKKRG